MAKRTLNKVLVARLGFRRALLVETFVMLWLMFASATGRDPESIEELAAEIGKDRATVYRWQADFREVFPEWSTPRDLLDHADKRRSARPRPLTMSEVRNLVLP